MSADTEIQLVRLLDDEKKGKRALDELVLANVGLCHKVVHKFPIKNASCSYDDLYQEAIAGLIYGIRKFDVTRGYRLSTYCYRWIQAYVTRYYQNHGRVIRVPVHMYGKQMDLNKCIETLTKELGRTPTAEEIQDMKENADAIASSMMNVSSLNQMVSESDELECLQGEDNTEDFDNTIDCDILLSKVKAEVSERDFSILIQRYGLCGETPHTLNEIAEKTGLTRSRCHQVEKNLLNKMREFALS